MTEKQLKERLLEVYQDAGAVIGTVGVLMSAFSKCADYGMEGTVRMSELIYSELAHVDARMQRLTETTVRMLNDVEDAVLAAESLEEEP